ncbi:MAG: SHOCT domain-containing protein [Methanofollis sp.]|uniref:SHOCT domain-containing protein n=1 Tax=Methanofollis sp. TaxID=2052835 RepID=UPI00260951EE|nr:SHOCT domain-containing protein [Methanofollis sp.]MDD4255247.1 SHOCT domain-containing protein [Methanofollis sp.]
MNGFMDPFWDGHHHMETWFGFPFFGWGMMLLWWALLLAIGWLVYRDAEQRGMNGLLWFILIILPFVGIVFLILYVLVRETSGRSQVSEKDRALEILRERYATGEISEEEYRRRKEELER